MSEEASEVAMSDKDMTFFIQNQRIYDVLLAILTATAPAAAKDLLEMHAGGGFVGPAPRFNGTFITDDVISQSDELSGEENSA